MKELNQEERIMAEDYISKMARKFEDGAAKRATVGKPSAHDVMAKVVKRQDDLDKQAERDRDQRR